MPPPPLLSFYLHFLHAATVLLIQDVHRRCKKAYRVHPGGCILLAKLLNGGAQKKPWEWKGSLSFHSACFIFLHLHGASPMQRCMCTIFSALPFLYSRSEFDNIKDLKKEDACSFCAAELHVVHRRCITLGHFIRCYVFHTVTLWSTPCLARHFIHLVQGKSQWIRWQSKDGTPTVSLKCNVGPILVLHFTPFAFLLASNRRQTVRFALF